MQRPEPRRESPGPQMAMGRIEHTLLDEGRASSPTDLRPSPAIPPYHTKVTAVSIYDKGPEPESPAPVMVGGYNGLSLDASRSLTCSGISTLPPFRSRNPPPRMRPAPSASRYTPGSSSTVRPTPPSGILPRR